ncbi:SDR family oxidoreductase [Rufibacter glacialis]|uniref:SDR family oxidoreductase n=1 Tax=Rufibacter glacialis TaxID=1259555 RepID=A0A5M8QLP0_9BACT|nr:SDR family oxidoreductase [Rufibacter glacialis]KAA6435563.1 SDR family oxidoreductase [Rufibacter glacialis]GGK64629.1 glucose a-dehydrogenase YxnA [Rufibacter glacialis]
MNYSLKPLQEQVIVITGASSGIGLATALAAAKKGATVVLAARNREALLEIEQEIRSQGGKAFHCVADVGRKEEVQWIAQVALQECGGFDTWINDAGVSIYGRLDEVSDEDNRRLFDTNFWGVVYGSQIAAQHLRSKGGAIINVGSEVSDIAIPLQGMYSASKHAVKAYTDALRIELMEDKAPVSVTLIKPAGIDTPYPEHAKNYTDKALTLPAPVYTPEEVAAAILHAAVHPHRDIMVGGGAKAMSALNKRFPGAMDWISSKIMSKEQLLDEPPVNKAGSLHQPSTAGNVRGNHKGYVMKTSLYTRAVMHPVATSAILAAAGATVYALFNRKALKNLSFPKGNTPKKEDSYASTDTTITQTTLLESERYPNYDRDLGDDTYTGQDTHLGTGRSSGLVGDGDAEDTRW